MDNFTSELIELAYSTAKARKRRRQHVSMPDLAGQIHRHWLNYRDGIIAMWANQIYDRVKQGRLLYLIERVSDLLEENGEFWEPPDDEDPPALQAEWTAWGLAALRWIYRERTGKAPLPRYTGEELAAWLSEKQLEQLPLFEMENLSRFKFILEPEKDPAAKEALAAYAMATENVALAKDLWAILHQLCFTYRGHPIDRLLLETLREFVRRVNERAEANIALTGRLEGAHHAAIQSVLAVMEDELTKNSDGRWMAFVLAKKDQSDTA